MLRLGQSTFIVQASFMIITYNRQNIFIVQATGGVKFYFIQGSHSGVCHFCNLKIDQVMKIKMLL
jgi:hypothetical protein